MTKNGTGRHYLLKVVRRGFDIHCMPPDLGVHYSLHESGEAHFQSERRAAEPGEEPPVAFVEGEAGTPIGKGIIRAPLGEQLRASGISTAIYSID